MIPFLVRFPAVVLLIPLPFPLSLSPPSIKTDSLWFRLRLWTRTSMTSAAHFHDRRHRRRTRSRCFYASARDPLWAADPGGRAPRPAGPWGGRQMRFLYEEAGKLPRVLLFVLFRLNINTFGHILDMFATRYITIRIDTNARISQIDKNWQILIGKIQWHY